MIHVQNLFALLKRTVLLVLLVCGLHNMADAQARYAVATGNWNATTTWSATSGGAPGASVPTAANDVFIGDFVVTLNVNGACLSLTIGATGGTPTFNIGAFTLTVSGNFTLNGDRNVLVSMTSSLSVLTIGGNLTLGPLVPVGRAMTLDMSNGVNNASTLNIAGSMIRNGDGVFTPGTASTVNYNGTAAQTINLTQFTYARLTANNTNIVTGATLGAAVTATNVTGNISVNSGLCRTNNLAVAMANSRTLTVALGATMDAGTTSILLGTTATATINGTFKTANTAGFSGAATTAIRSTNTPTITLGASSIIEYNNSSAAQTVTNRTDYANVTLTGLSKTIGTAVSQPITLSATLIINSGATYLGSTFNPILNIRGNFSNSGTFTQGTGLLTFNGTTAQTILGSSATTFSNNVTINNSAGININTSPTINGVLTFTNGIITTGANKVSIGSAGSVSRTSGHVNGNLERFIPNTVNPSGTYDIGGATNYTPVLISFAGTTSGSGSLTAFTTAGDDADIVNSGINNTKSVNRTWTVTNSSVGGFTSYSGTFTFVAGDIDGGANTASFVVRKVLAGTWATTNLVAANPLSTQANGMTTFGRFQIGEAGTITVATQPTNASVCAPTGTSFSSTSTSIPAPSVKWQRDPNTSTFADVTGTMDGSVYTNFTTTTLNISNVTGLNNYKYRTVFTNINGTATSTGATLTVVTGFPAAAGTITGTATVCQSQTGIAYSVPAITGVTSYTWTYTGGGFSIASGTGTNSITANFSSSATSGNLTVSGVNACGNGLPSTNFAITVTTLPAAASNIAGTATVCQSQMGVAYSVGAISQATSYTWIYSGSGFSIATGSGTNSITANFSASATSGNLTVRGVNACGNGTYSPNYALTVLTSVPAGAGTITGTSSACRTVIYSYSVPAIAGATSYLWTYSGTGATLSGNTASITGSFSSTSTAGNLTVRGVNACGTGTASPAIAITFISCAPHNSCNGCHLTHNSAGGAITAVAGNPNLCMSCHNSAGMASAKPFSNADKAVPGVSGTSHAWDKLAVNATYETNRTTNSEMLKRLPGDFIICSTCHNQHTNAPATPFLRASNAGNAMCKDCHSARNRRTWVVDNVNNRGTHPVGTLYPTPDSRFNAAPTGSIVLVSGNVECTSCHKQHYAASTDGYILRQTNNAALCTSCHTYTPHQGMDCKVCHQPHNPNKANIYMIRNTIATPNSGNKTVVFTAQTGTNSFADGDATYDGVCEVCHTTATYHRNAGGTPSHNNGAKCTTCHKHNANSTSFTACTPCHTSTFPQFTTDAHAPHTKGLYTFPCSTCHFNYGMGGSSETTHPSSTININFDPNGMARRKGADANTPAYNSATKTCTNVYCHSNGRTAHRGQDAGYPAAGTYTWSGTLGPQIPTYTATPNWATGKFTGCRGSCHGGPADKPPAPTYTITKSSPAGQIATQSDLALLADNHPHGMLDNDRFASTIGAQPTGWGAWNQCFWCHSTNGAGADVANFQGTYSTAFHVDGQTYFKPILYSNGGTFAPFNLRAADGGSDAHCGDPGGGAACW